jgi:hypothetical protein
MPKHSASDRDLVQAFTALGFEQVLTDIGIDEKKILSFVGEIRALIKNLTEWAAKFDCAAQRQVLTALGIDQTVLQQSAVEIRALIKNLTELAKIDCAALQREIVAKLCDTDAAQKARSAKVIYDIIDEELQRWQENHTSGFVQTIPGLADKIHRKVMARIRGLTEKQVHKQVLKKWRPCDPKDEAGVKREKNRIARYLYRSKNNGHLPTLGAWLPISFRPYAISLPPN